MGRADERQALDVLVHSAIFLELMFPIHFMNQERKSYKTLGNGKLKRKSQNILSYILCAEIPILVMC